MHEIHQFIERCKFLYSLGERKDCVPHCDQRRLRASAHRDHEDSEHRGHADRSPVINKMSIVITGIAAS